MLTTLTMIMTFVLPAPFHAKYLHSSRPLSRAITHSHNFERKKKKKPVTALQLPGE